MNSREVRDLEVKIANMDQYINEKLQESRNYPIILILGQTGSGKSSLLDILSGQKVTVSMGKGRKIELVGRGIVNGCKSGTREPIIEYFDQEEIIICDCPGFEDSDGTYQEILNACADNSLLDSDTNKIKILMVIQATDFEGRASEIRNSIQRMERMFVTKLDKRKVGLVITKGDADIEGMDYINTIKPTAPIDILDWINAFTKDNVFIFPKASKLDIEKQYDFDDHQRLMDFLRKDYIENPDHKISLNDKTLIELTGIRNNHLGSIKDLIENLFVKISKNYKSEKRKEICDWLTIMHRIQRKKINTIKDVNDVFQNSLKNPEDYQYYFDILKEFEPFERFIEKVQDIKVDNSFLNEVIRELVQTCIIELEKSFLENENIEYSMEIKKLRNQLQLYQHNSTNSSCLLQ